MDKSDAALVSAFADGEVTADERVRVEALLASDPEAQRELHAVREVKARLAAAPHLKAPPQIHTGVMQRLAESRIRPTTGHGTAGSASRGGVLLFFRRYAWSGSVAACLMAGVGIYLLTTGGDSRVSAPDAVAHSGKENTLILESSAVAVDRELLKAQLAFSPYDPSPVQDNMRTQGASPTRMRVSRNDAPQLKSNMGNVNKVTRDAIEAPKSSNSIAVRVDDQEFSPDQVADFMNQIALNASARARVTLVQAPAASETWREAGTNGSGFGGVGGGGKAVGAGESAKEAKSEKRKAEGAGPRSEDLPQDGANAGDGDDDADMSGARVLPVRRGAQNEAEAPPPAAPSGATDLSTDEAPQQALAKTPEETPEQTSAEAPTNAVGKAENADSAAPLPQDMPRADTSSALESSNAASQAGEENNRQGGVMPDVDHSGEVDLIVIEVPLDELDAVVKAFERVCRERNWGLSSSDANLSRYLAQVSASTMAEDEQVSTPLVERPSSADKPSGDAEEPMLRLYLKITRKE